MNLKNCEKKEKSLAELTVEISPEEFESAMSKAFAKNRNRIAVPGFRKGKAPRKIVEKMYGASIFHSDALDTLLPEALNCAVKESGLIIIGKPQVTDIEIKEENAGADVTITVILYPEVVLGEYKGLSAYKPSVDILDGEIDGEIELIRNRNARYEKADRPVIDGDIAVIDYEGFVDGKPFNGGKGENYELTIGSNTLIPGFEEKIIGMKTCEERDLNLVFPRDYSEPLAGRPVVFKVKLNEIKEKILPDLDDEFVKDVSEFDTLDEYKADIREKLQNARQIEVDEAFESDLLGKVVDSMEVDVPELMVEDQMDRAVENYSQQVKSYGMDFDEYLKMMNMSPEIFRENTRASSERQVKIRLALEKIAALEGIEVSDEQVESEYIKAAADLRMDIDALKTSVPKQRIVMETKMRQASKLVIDSATALNSKSEIHNSELSVDED